MAPTLRSAAITSKDPSKTKTAAPLALPPLVAEPSISATNVAGFSIEAIEQLSSILVKDSKRVIINADAHAAKAQADLVAILGALDDIRHDLIDGVFRGDRALEKTKKKVTFASDVPVKREVESSDGLGDERARDFSCAIFVILIGVLFYVCQRLLQEPHAL